MLLVVTVTGHRRVLSFCLTSVLQHPSLCLVNLLGKSAVAPAMTSAELNAMNDVTLRTASCFYD